MKILMAEDEPISRRVTGAMLARAGHRVTAVAGGAEAVAATAAEAFDLVLLDVQMGAMDGPAAARGIRALPHGATVPILALTASPWPEAMDACRAAGMNGCLIKPLDLARLDAALAAGDWPGDAPAASAVPLLDRAYLASLAADLPPELFGAALAACDVSLAQSLGGLAAAPAPSDAVALLHKLRGTAGTYGLTALHAGAGEVEALARAADGNLAAALAGLLRLAEDSREAFAGYCRALG